MILSKRIPPYDHLRILSKIAVRDNGCWEWVGAIHKASGYGTFALSRNDFYKPHRLFYDLFIGIKSQETVIDHICKNKVCCNPNHLREVTHAFNVLENSIGIAQAKKKQTHCIHGHEFDVGNTRIGTRGQRVCIECKKRIDREGRARKLLK